MPLDASEALVANVPPREFWGVCETPSISVRAKNRVHMREKEILEDEDDDDVTDKNSLETEDTDLSPGIKHTQMSFTMKSLKGASERM